MKLRDYQVPAVEQSSHILFDKGVCLMAMECRTGKTLSSLFVAQNVGSKGVLFITPLKAIPSIEKDYDMMKKDNPHIFSINIVNPESILAKFKKAEKMAFDVVATRYPKLSKKGVRFKALVSEEKETQLALLAPYVSGNVDTIIVDECHRQGAFPKPSGAMQCIKRLAKGKKVILLSGTPNPESHSMFFHEFAISENSPWKEYKDFYAWVRAGYVDVEEKMVNGFKVADYSKGNEERIMRDIAPYMVTLTQEEAGFESNVVEHELRVNMTALSQNLIRNLKRERALNISSIKLSPIGNAPASQEYLVADTAADLLNKIHQLSGGTIKIGEHYYIVDASKADYLRDKFNGHHYCVFYSYKAERELLKQTLSNVTEDWQEFQADSTKIFIGQIRSVREGIKLDTAEFSVFYSMEYSYVSYAQGMMRIVSKERTDVSNVYFLTSQCKIEKMILDTVHDKKDFTLAVYNNAYKNY